ncbi:GPO family capsid scaffolding protein [Gilliamella sp. N-W3]|uniref:GPO family capsid scaffolding protein n=1 Tax=Gilliamella sp. N-W3 TaxID=1970474 RepID=UPI000A32CDB5|nr:GPO family capsid scaffolding protein [Gilliamella sp. N-W3]OTQ80503.1 GPO family capsid scaffolding protein [Gilliamella sp. N-W3]
MTLEVNKSKKYKSKWFRIAVEGATTDGRKILREWISQMAQNYNRDVYGARVNLEHIKGYSPDSPFKRYGDVLALKAEEIKTGPLAGRLALLAQIEPTDELIQLNKTRQKVYSSIEVNPEFADTGEAYLVGLAVTDDPASLGTEFLEFSATANTNPLASRKLSPNNLFTAAEETLIEFEDDTVADKSFSSILERLTNLFKNKSSIDSTKFNQLAEIIEQFAASTVDRVTQLENQVNLLKTEFTSVKKQNDELIELLSETPDSPYRPVSSGGSANIETDC